MYIKLTYTRPSRRGILVWLLLLVLVCTVYGGMGILEGVSRRGGHNNNNKNGGGGIIMRGRMGRRGRGGGKSSSSCSDSKYTLSIRDTLLQTTESYLSTTTATKAGTKEVVVGAISSCPSPTSVIGGPHSPTWRNAHIMFQSVLANGRSVACANASALVPLSVRERLQRSSASQSATTTSQAPAPTNHAAAPMLKDGVHCLTPLGRFLLHTRPTTTTTSTTTTIPSLPSIVAAAAGNMIGVGGGGDSGIGSKEAIIQLIEESLYKGLVVGSTRSKDEMDNANILNALQISISGGGGGGASPSTPPSSSIPKFVMAPHKGITVNKRLQLQMLGVETRGWLRSLFPERMAHVSTDVVLSTTSNGHSNPNQHQQQMPLLATPGNSPISKYVQSAMFVINSTQTLEEEEAAKWIPTTSFLSIAQHQHQLLAKLRRQWIQAGWGSKLHTLGHQPPQSKIDELESAFIASLPTAASFTLSTGDGGDDHHHLTTAAPSFDGNNASHNGGGGSRRISSLLKVPLSLQSNGISMGDEGLYQGTPFTVLSNNFPRAFRLDDVLTPEHQSQYIKHAQERIERSKVVDGAAEAVDTVRTSFGMFVYDRNIPADKRFRTIASKLTGLPEENIEATQILRYTPGQYYKPHPDFFGRGSPILKRGGERVATMLAWLNDVPEGGETKFPNSLDPNTGKPLLVEPRAGSAILFYSMTEGGSTDRGSIHEAIPPVGGEKWVAVLWIREHKFT